MCGMCVRERESASKFLCVRLLLVTGPPFLERWPQNWRRGQRHWVPSCLCSFGSHGLRLLISPGASSCLSSLLAVSHSSSHLSYSLQPAFLREHLEPSKSAKEGDSAGGMGQQDSVTLTWSEILVRFKTAYGKSGRVCVIPGINTLCLPRWLIFFFQPSTSMLPIEADMDLLKPKMQNIQEF